MKFNLFKPSDWIIVYKSEGRYTTPEIRKYNAPSEKYYCYLMYSKSRNKYKITHSLEYDYDWIEPSNPYQACVDEMIHLQNNDK